VLAYSTGSRLLSCVEVFPWMGLNGKTASASHSPPRTALSSSSPDKPLEDRPGSLVVEPTLYEPQSYLFGATFRFTTAPQPNRDTLAQSVWMLMPSEKNTRPNHTPISTPTRTINHEQSTSRKRTCKFLQVSLNSGEQPHYKSLGFTR
jgi:hypothetical protein